MFVIAIRLFHLLHVNGANLFLSFCGLFHGGVEQNEILVFSFGLSHAVGSTFAEPAIGNGQLGFGHEFAGIVSVHQRLQRDSGNFIAATFNIANRFIEQHFIWLLGIFTNRIFVFMAHAPAGGEHGGGRNNYAKYGTEGLKLHAFPVPQLLII